MTTKATAAAIQAWQRRRNASATLARAAALDEAQAAADAVARAKDRGAVPVTIAYTPDGAARIQRHATWRLPLGHPDAHLIDRMAAAGQLHDRHYANALALYHLWRKAGLDPACAGRYAPQARGHGADGTCYLTRYSREMGALAHPQQRALADMLRGIHPGRAGLSHALAGLDRLDHLPAEFDATMWAEDDA